MSRPPPTSSSSRAAATEALIARGETDLARWADVGSLATQWDSRAQLAGRLVGETPVRVLDVGAGAMALKAFLPPGSAYTPADVVARCDGCLVADLNRRQFPPGDYDVVSFLGVLEYIHDPAWPLRQAHAAAPRLIATYCTHAEAGGDVGYRRGMGWVNDLTRDQFEKLLAAAGWAVEHAVEYKRGTGNIQYVWACRRAP